MAGYRFWLQSSLSVVLALAIVQSGRSQNTNTVPPAVFENGVLQVSKPVSTTGSICKVYSLRDFEDDPPRLYGPDEVNLCQWIAETIPDMIQPESWKQHGVKLCYHAPSKTLVVNHTSAVHAQVDELLQNLKKSLPQQKVTANRTKHDPAAAPAVFYSPIEKVPAGPVHAGPSSYPVPFPPQAPKHLFHFIIRYEGEGIIDSSVVKFTKALSNASSISTSKDVGPPTVECPAPVPTPQYLSQPAQYGYPPASTSSQRGSTWGNAPVMPPADPAPTPRNPSAPPPQTSGYSELLPPPTPLPPATPLPPNRAAPAEKSVLPYTPPPPPPPVTIP
jgi:hypothetical protein